MIRVGSPSDSATAPSIWLNSPMNLIGPPSTVARQRGNPSTMAPSAATHNGHDVANIPRHESWEPGFKEELRRVSGTR